MAAGLPEYIPYLWEVAMKKSVVTKPEKLDEEWVELILSALSVGISPQEIKEFFRERL